MGIMYQKVLNKTCLKPDLDPMLWHIDMEPIDVCVKNSFRNHEQFLKKPKLHYGSCT